MSLVHVSALLSLIKSCVTILSSSTPHTHTTLTHHTPLTCSIKHLDPNSALRSHSYVSPNIGLNGLLTRLAAQHEVERGSLKLTFGVVRGKEGEEGEERESRGRKGRRETMCIETRMRKRSMKVKRWRMERSEYGTHKHNPHTMYLLSPPHTLTSPTHLPPLPTHTHTHSLPHTHHTHQHMRSFPNSFQPRNTIAMFTTSRLWNQMKTLRRKDNLTVHVHVSPRVK